MQSSKQELIMAAKKEKKLTGAFALFKPSSNRVQANFVPFVLLYFVPAILSLIRSASTPRSGELEGAGRTFGSIPAAALVGIVTFGIVFAIVFIVVSLFIQAMRYRLELDTAAGHKPGFKPLFEAAKKYWLRLLGLSIIVGLLIFVGILLLIVPGIIMIRRYFFAPYVLVDKDTTISEALRQSAALSKPYAGYVWSLIGMFILLSLPAIIPFIGSLAAAWLTMLYSVAPALRYQEIKKLS